MRDPYLYPDVPVLKNKGGIKDAELLRQAEADITKISMIAAYNTVFPKFNADALCEIHKIIFGEIYDFAGKFRTIQMIKSEEVLGGDTVRYAYPCDISAELTALDTKISQLHSNDDPHDLIFKVVRLTAAMWQTHPFREGNTRAVVAFSVLLLEKLGIEIDYTLFEKHASYMRNALVWGAQSIYSKFEYLERIYFDAAGLVVSNETVDTKDYTTINGYYVADYKEKEHEYSEE